MAGGRNTPAPRSRGPVTPADITWTVTPGALAVLNPLRHGLGDWYVRTKTSVQQQLADYFSSKPDCLDKLGASISPVGARKRGGKCLKVRCPLPGSGKSGGLRLGVVAYCA